MPEEATLTLSNELSDLDKVLEFVADLCARNSIPPDIEYDLNLVMDEVFTNVIRHAHPQGGEHPFTLQFTVSPQEFVARVEDDGIEFNPLDHPAPNLDTPLAERKEGGLGIFLIRQIMTSVEYQRVGGKNITILRKKLA